MKKLFITGVIAVLAFSSVAQAEMEISGNVTTLAVYQHDNTNAAASPGAGGITQGDFSFVATGSADHFGFVVDQAEIDVENEFGENIMARMDLDFYDLGTPGTSGPAGVSAFFLEQAYVTANIAIGNGLEFMIGKFNAPIGLESVDRHENVFSTYTPGWIYLTPTQVIGTKLYYEFNDHWNMDIAAVNSMNNVFVGNSAYPSGLFRLGVQWGDEDRMSYVHIAAGFGPEQSITATGSSSNRSFDLLGAFWGNWAIGDYWDLGWEALYRQTDSFTGVGANQKAIAGQIYVVYQPSDVWTVQIRGANFWEINPPFARTGTGASTGGGTWSGFEGMTYSGTLGATYQITDDAQVKWEYRFDLGSTAGPTSNGNFHTGVAEFAYSF